MNTKNTYTQTLDTQIEDADYPALYNAADAASLKSQRYYYRALYSYLILLIIAAFVSYKSAQNTYGAIISALLFIITLGILIWMKVQRPEDIWYNGRAVAESVKTRAWRWMMRADPYFEQVSEEQAQKELLADLKAILSQNRSISSYLEWTSELGEAISENMKSIRSYNWEKRLEVYRVERINEQLGWYQRKSIFNKKWAKRWFVASVFLHGVAVILLLYRIKDPSSSLPIEVVATAASAVLTWAQAKKHNELNSSYSLAAHEILIMKGESVSVSNEEKLSEFVVDSESAFSREHTQWIARKNG